MRLGEKRKLAEEWIGESMVDGTYEKNREPMKKIFACCCEMEKEDRLMTKAEFDRLVLDMIAA